MQGVRRFGHIPITGRSALTGPRSPLISRSRQRGGRETSTSVSQVGDPKMNDVRGASIRVILVCVGIAVALGISTGLGDPEGALEMLVKSVIGALLGIAVSRTLVPAAWFDQPWKAALTIAAAVTLPIAAIVLGFQIWVHHSHLTASLLTTLLPRVFGTLLVMVAIALLVRRHPTRTHEAPQGAPPPKFLARVPAKLSGAELYAVEAEDHYLRLHTSLGQDLILMRLSDAIVELEGIEGAQTHRSWWVARAGIQEVERGDGRATLTLKDGAEAPVSRGYAKALRDAGWF